MVKDSPDIPLTAIAAINKGNKIKAIKIIRRETSVDLKEAKEIVENYIETHPELEDKYRSSVSADKMRMIIIAIIVLVVVYFMLR